ncbi:MAG: hypothetical protein PVG66_12370 [Chromatiales bacterium]|jgi:hypothetical protein
MSSLHQQILFLPARFARESALIHTSCYNLAQSILERSELPYVPVSIDSMQYLAIIELNDIWFADTSSRISHDDQPGYRIMLSWHPHLAESRSEQDQHIAMEVTYYAPELEQLQQRLTGEFYKALMLLDAKFPQTTVPSQPYSIVPLTNQAV